MEKREEIQTLGSHSNEPSISPKSSCDDGDDILEKEQGGSVVKSCKRIPCVCSTRTAESIPPPTAGYAIIYRRLYKGH